MPPDDSRVIRRRLALWLTVCVLSLLGGCAAPIARAPAVSTIYVEPGSTVAAVDFGLAGRIAVKDARQGFSGGVRWHHAGNGDDILLLSPLGQAVAQIQRDSAGIRLTTSAQEIYHAADAESLTEQVLGWRLPLAGLQYWVRGTHAPATAAELDLDGAGRIVALRQDGWEIAYASYFPPQQAAATARPRIMLLSRGDLEIRLVIDDWSNE